MKIERIDDYQIHSYDCDLNGRLSLPVLTRFLQDSAWSQSNDMQIGYHKLNENNMTWVLYKQYIEMDKWAVWGDTIRIKTWPSQFDRLICYREFEIFIKNELVGKISSSWLVISLDTRRPVRKEKYYSDNLQVGTPLLFPEKIKEKMKTNDQENSVRTQQVHLSDIDVNNHVNNSCYPMWCLNSYPLDFYINHRLHSIEHQFVAEARFGDELKIVTNHQEGLKYEHSVKRDGKFLYLLKLEWQEEGSKKITKDM